MSKSKTRGCIGDDKINSSHMVNISDTTMGCFQESIVNSEVMDALNAIASNTKIPTQNLKFNYPDFSGYSKMAESYLESVSTPIIDKILENLNQYNQIASKNIAKINESYFYEWYTAILEEMYSKTDVVDVYRNTCILGIRKGLTRTLCNHDWCPHALFIDPEAKGMEHELVFPFEHKDKKLNPKNIDDIVFKYFNDQAVHNITGRWSDYVDSDLHKRIVREAAESYFEEKYVLTICCMATIWEGIIRNKLEISNKEGKNYKTLVHNRLIEKGHSGALLDFYYDKILKQCYKHDDLLTDVPCRNAIAHGRYTEYPSRKSALNAILMTDLVLSL